MKKNGFYLLWILCFYTGCQQSTNNNESKKGNQIPPKPISTLIPEYRGSVNTKAVAQYSEKIDNPLNDWYFSVMLYETPKTFQYLIKLKYEEIRGEDTLKLPNFGISPKPVIQKGKEKYSCIIGFLDKNNQFREYKKVYVKGNHLKITALKHYAVSSHSYEE